MCVCVLLVALSAVPSDPSCRIMEQILSHRAKACICDFEWQARVAYNEVPNGGPNKRK